MVILQKIGILVVGGALGTLCRYGLAGLAQKFLGDGFSWGTFVVNMAGTFLIGFGWALAEDKLLFSPNTRLFLLVGFCGAFTTFSTYIFESFEFIRQGDYWIAGINVLASTMLGFMFLLAGITLGRWI